MTKAQLQQRLTECEAARAKDKAIIDQLRDEIEDLKSPTPEPEPEPTPEPEPEPTPPPTSTRSFVFPWPSTALWEKPLPVLPELVPDSSARVAKFITAGKLATAGIICHNYGVPVVRARTDGKRFTLTANPSRSENYSLTQLNSAGGVPIPDGALPSLGTDCHLSVIDLATGRAWDMGGAGYVSGAWRASYGHTYLLDDEFSGIARSNVVGATAANFPLLGGLIRPEEIEAGVIEHRITFCSPARENLHYYPATHHGNGTATPGTISEGSLTQLDPALNVDALAIASWAKTVLKAWQKYGAYHRDGGGQTNVYAEDDINRPGAWAALGLGATYNQLGGTKIPWDRLRVLAPTARNNT